MKFWPISRDTSKMGNQGVPKKTRALLRLTLVVFIVVLVGMVIRIRPFDVITSGAQALWNQNELYIFVEQNKVASSQSVWSFSWSLAKGWLAIPSSASFHRIDCTVYRITSSAVEEHFAKGWNVAGSLAPYKGMPHAFIGGKQDAGVYRWTGDGFAKLSPSEALAVQSGYTYTDDLFKHEGWSGVQFLLPRGTADHRVVLGGIPFVIRVTHTDDGITKIELIRTEDPKSVSLLYDFKNMAGFLSNVQYKGLVKGPVALSPGS
jgi:hypothetical protein